MNRVDSPAALLNPALCAVVSLQVLEAWKNLLAAVEGRRAKLVDTGDKFRFFSMVRDLMLWMEDVIRLIEAQEKPRYQAACSMFSCGKNNHFETLIRVSDGYIIPVVFVEVVTLSDLTFCFCLFRDVSSVELLMNNHQGIKAEIDARNDSFTTCIELGKALLARKHYASEEVETSSVTEQNFRISAHMIHM